MKCPVCGSEMELDTHRKIPLQMCYNCGYIEGRRIETVVSKSNFEHLKAMNLNEMAAFLAKGLRLDEAVVAKWLEERS